MTARYRMTCLTGMGIALLFTIAPLEAQTRSLDYPAARRVDQVDVYHGVEVADPYRWMESLDSPELQAWMKAQDALRAEFLSDRDLVVRLQQRMESIRNFPSVGLPIVRGEMTFNTRREVGGTFGALYIQSDKIGEPRLLIDFERLNSEGNSAFLNSVSPDGRYVAYNTAQGQSRWNTVRIMRVEDGETLSDTLIGFYSGRSNVAWRRDGAGFYYARYAVPDNPQAPLGLAAIRYHEIGSSQEADQLVYERPDDPQLSFTLRVTHDDRYLILSGSESGGTFNGMYDRLFYKDLRRAGSEVTELLPEMEGAHSFEGNEGTQWWIRTTHQAPRMRVVQVDVSRPSPEHWREIIPEGDASMQAVSEIGDRLVVQYIQDARTVVRVFDFDGQLQHEIDRLTPSMFGFADDRDSHVTFYGASQLYDPGTLYRLDVHTGKSELHFRPELNHNPDDFVTKQVFFESRDGTRIPMFLLHHRDLQLDGANPVFMYAYGAWAWSAFPWQRHMIPWMELGGVYAVPNIRGGGEYGEAWHQAGIRRNKQNGIDDFIAAAEWLIKNDYTSPARMIGNGGSASGILPAAAMIQRPQLFGAAVINFPALDQLRYDRFGSAKSWAPEFGDPADPDDFEVLHSYSPYHTVAEGVCYPATWIQVGHQDDTTTPMHGYKFAAALQATQRCDNPVLLKIAWGAGHSYGLTPEQSRETQAEELAFLVKVLNIDPSPRGQPALER